MKLKEYYVTQSVSRELNAINYSSGFLNPSQLVRSPGSEKLPRLQRFDVALENGSKIGRKRGIFALRGGG